MTDASHVLSQSPVAGSLVFATPLRRLGAMLYDALLCIAILMAVSALMLPFMTSGQTIEQLSGVQSVIYRLGLLVVLGAFFCFFWVSKGRTLGMQAWKLRVQTVEGDKLSWRDAMLRVVMACVPVLVAAMVLEVAGSAARLHIGVEIAVLVGVPLISYLFGYADVERRALHERWLNTRIVRT
jgi:uncharacterized RDD family membrane protein YckC